MKIHLIGSPKYGAMLHQKNGYDINVTWSLYHRLASN